MRRKSTSFMLRASVLALALSLMSIGLPAMAQDEGPGTPTVVFPLIGTVGEAFAGGIYAYLKVNEAVGAPVWVMSELCSVKPGDKIEVTAGQVYAQVYSENMGITFENLIIATQLKINGVDVKAFAAHDLPAGCTIGRPAKK